MRLRWEKESEERKGKERKDNRRQKAKNMSPTWEKEKGLARKSVKDI